MFFDFAYQIRVQLVARLENNDTVMDNDQIWLAAALTLNEHNAYDFKASFNATQDIIYSEVCTIHPLLKHSYQSSC